MAAIITCVAKKAMARIAIRLLALAKGSDGKNIGADVDGIEKAIAGVI